MSPRGILTVARLELLQRLRGARWYVALGAWVLLIAGITLLTWLGLRTAEFDTGSTTFDVVLFFVLGFGMLIMPALTATSVNGDRDQGVLATLQTTLLSPADIILGKLLASFVISTAFLVAVTPFLLVAVLQGGVDLLGAARAIVVMTVILLVVCAIGLMFSTLVARPVGSAVLTYLLVAGLVFLTPITFFMSALLVTQEEEVTVYGYPPSSRMEPAPTTCQHFTESRDVTHTERVWWLLGMNPFVIVADASPSPPQARQGRSPEGFAPMYYISLGTRLAKAGPEKVVDQCWARYDGVGSDVRRAEDAGPVWPYGLLFFGIAGVAATLIAIRRVRTPVRALPSGTRIA